MEFSLFNLMTLPRDGVTRAEVFGQMKTMVVLADQAGFETLVVTVDIPTSTRRDRDIRNGLSVPPELKLEPGEHSQHSEKGGRAVGA